MRFNDQGISTLRIILIVGAVMLALLAVVVFYWHVHGATQFSAGAIPTEEQKAYFRQLEFTDLHMSVAQNFLGDNVTYLDARVRNEGTKTVRRLDVDLTFVDMLSQVILRERVYPVSERTIPLNPGESRAFRITFEHIPAEWNQAAPAITPVYVQFK
jgi:hypothetical protein